MLTIKCTYIHTLCSRGMEKGEQRVVLRVGVEVHDMGMKGLKINSKSLER